MLSKVLNINQGEAKRVRAGMGTVSKNLLSQGWSFKIEGIGSFSLSITGSFPSPDASLNRLHGVKHGPIIDNVEDKASRGINSKLTPGHGVQLSGKDIKVVGTDSLVGIHILDASGNGVSVPAGDLLENGPTNLLFICPPLSAGEYTIHITTQYKDLTHPRSYLFNAPLTVSIP